MKNMVERESAAREVYYWLKRAKIVGIIAIVAPFIAAVFAFLNPLAGAVAGLFASAASAFYLKGFLEQMKYLEGKYPLKVAIVAPTREQK